MLLLFYRKSDFYAQKITFMLKLKQRLLTIKMTYGNYFSQLLK